ncbi:hypothetical protein B0H14DRAFT_3423858 [Mycena olivaceomarginata]|nr:hypothetical protein B0H14DRAFT_3423858 [Mycena olivaceomarginata]
MDGGVAAMTSTSNLSASITRILLLAGFSKELKTSDIRAVFTIWEPVKCGFDIKWRDDISLFIVFHEPSEAERVYLQGIALPSQIFISWLPGAVLTPYNAPDAHNVIQAVRLGIPYLRAKSKGCGGSAY